MITVKAIYAKGKIIPEEADKLAWFKQRLTDGDYVELTFKKFAETRSDRASNYLHALLSRYSRALGLSLINAKNELCINFGPCIRYGENFEPPTYGGHFIEYHGELYFRKTTKEYNIHEMGGLIEGVLAACQDNGIDVDDLVIENKDWYGRKTA